MKRFALKLFLFAFTLFAAWTAFPAETAFEAYLHRGDGETLPYPPRFQKVLVLFSADTTKADRDAFLAGLEEVRIRHLKEYREIVRKWWEYRKAESEKDYDEAAWDRFTLEQEFERDFYHNPWFLKLVDVQMVRTDKAFFPLENAGPVFDPRNDLSSPLWDLNSLDVRGWGIRSELWSDFWIAEGPIFADAEALIVVASDRISTAVNQMIQDGSFTAPLKNDVVVLFAGVSSFDESIRERQMKGDGAIDPAKAPYAFSIRHSPDPWPNTELALSVFPKTKKVILLTPEKCWNAEMENEYRAKLGPGKTLKTVPMSEIGEKGRTEADIEEMKNRFAATVQAEIAPDAVVVSMSSVETGQDPASWLPAGFDACPVFTDTKPVFPSAVGGFRRSMKNLGVQTAELLERLSEDSLRNNKLPPLVMEEDELWLNATALRRYGLDASAFPGANLTDSESGEVVTPAEKRSWAWKHIRLVNAVIAALFLASFAFLLLSVRGGRRKRRLAELIYGALPARVLVMDREGRIIAHHSQYGELEQNAEFLWKNIGEVPWLQTIGAIKIVREVFDSGKTVVHELEIDGERRVVVLARTPSDVFGRPAVIAVSSISPERTSPLLK